jgi:regulatory protein
MRRDEAPLTAERLRRSALWHVERYETTTARVRSSLMRRVRRAAAEDRVDAEEAAVWVEAILADLARLGLVDDARYAEGAVRRMRDRGASTRRIQASLASKGVGEEVVTVAVDADERRDDDAICRFAARRGFGPWRRVGATPERKQKELAALGRAGFSYTSARRVVEAASVEELEG